MAQMWIFTGHDVVAVAPQPQSDSISLKTNSRLDWAKVVRQDFSHRLKRSSVMPLVKTIATLASVAAIASSVLALSWVGLALLGF